MGRARFFILIFLITVLAVCGFVLQAAPPDSPVYVGMSGSKYHRFDCRTLRSAKRTLSLAGAVRAGYEPCMVCRPDGVDGFSGAAAPLAAAAGGEAAGESPIYRVSIENLSSSGQADFKKMLRGKVSRHVDGDTVHITLENPPAGFEKVEKIRMIGVDTPETVHPAREVEYFGREASDFTKKALLGNDVYIAFDWDTRDKYGRLLVYIYRPDGVCHNAALIEQGFAHAYTRFPFQFLEEFRNLERAARAAGKGLWANGNTGL